MNIKERLKAARARAGMNQTQLAAKAKISQGVISNIERGKAGGSKHIASIAAACGVSTDWLAIGVGSMDGADSEAGFIEGAVYKLQNNIQGVPVLGKAELGPEGFWSESEHPVGQGDGFVNWPTKDPNAYAVEANGDSMAPRIKHREFIIVEPNTEIMSGDEVLIKTAESPSRCMVKVLQYTRDGRHHLGNINTEYEDFRLDEDKVAKMHFVAGIAKRRMHRHE